ncbi:MAG TPA: 2OG-Fe(II) oxygenase [Acidimicrobiia bacterium]|nr:2OG-Fe(II) oxygenase [Acidimicrobiia bacterium]
MTSAGSSADASSFVFSRGSLLPLAQVGHEDYVSAQLFPHIVIDDFNRHASLNLDRRINPLLYLNPDWEESDGGHLERSPDRRGVGRPLDVVHGTTRRAVEVQRAPAREAVDATGGHRMAFTTERAPGARALTSHLVPGHDSASKPPR